MDRLKLKEKLLLRRREHDSIAEKLAAVVKELERASTPLLRKRHHDLLDALQLLDAEVQSLTGRLLAMSYKR